MRLRFFINLTGTLLIAASNLASAQGLVLGPGGSTCDAMLTSISSYGPRQEAIYQSWAQGYLTALNVGDLDVSEPARIELHDLSNWNEAWESLRNFCTENPQVDVVSALVSLWRQLPPIAFEDVAPENDAP